jgi:SM-20-related protein
LIEKGFFFKLNHAGEDRGHGSYLNPLHRLPRIAIRRGILPERDVDALFDWAVAQEADFVASNLADGRIDPARRNSLSFPRDRMLPWRDVMVSRLTDLLPQLLAETGMERFALHRIELDALAYRDGAFFQRHIDAVIRSTDEQAADERILTAVYYFHREPKGFSGGELRLSSIARDMPTLRDIVPERNCLVAFPSWTPHEVLPVRCPSGQFADSRFAINLWARRLRAR